MAAVPFRPFRELAFVLAAAVAIPMLATLAFSAIGHPECASIPEDVGPCGYWARVAYYGPFIMVWGVIFCGGFGATLWLIAVAARGVFLAARRRRERIRAGQHA
ncbi:hypothetical protein ACFYTS_17525 [Nocardia sp. NPDC004151]|uniref:hypothetical protein n=1 Tax=Nocardia sp. NPDC004151 TaxID=3364304 RepID=UPI00369D82EA